MEEHNSIHVLGTMQSNTAKSSCLEMDSPYILRGRVWCFGDDINTDIISPAEFMDKSYEIIGKHLFDRVSHGFTNMISKGDFIVAGRNFGSGSSRETAQIALKYAGVGAVIAKSYARIFFRNSINVGLPVVSFKNTELIKQGDELKINLLEGIIENISQGQIYQSEKLPEHVLKIIKLGGLKNYLKEYIGGVNA